MKRHNRSGWLILIILLCPVLFFFFGPVILSPNSYFFGFGGDATKNYFIPAYYAKHDSGLHFAGMHYPYGEHIMYTDGHFPVSWLLQKLEHAGINAADYMAGVINYLMLASLVLCAVFLFLLLLELNVSPWFAAVTSVAITMLAPQVQRMTGLYSLSYPCLIPIIFYSLHRIYIDRHSWKWVACGSFVICFFGLIHLYNAVITSAFILSFAALGFLLAENKNQFQFRVILMMIMALIPVFILQTFIGITDTIEDRIKVPWGFDFGYATFESVFLPPDWNGLSFISNNQLFEEGYAYIGMVAELAFIIFIIRVGYAISTGRKLLSIPPMNSFILISFIAAIPLLLYSMQYPWCLGLEWLMEKIPVVRQFRAVGRFAIPFYYASALFGAYFLYLTFQYIKTRSKIATAIILITIMGLWMYEGFANLLEVKKSLVAGADAQKQWHDERYINVLRAAGYKPEDFQAILSFPFYHIGSEKFWLESYNGLEESIKLSMNTGLPLVDSYLGRTSVSQSARLVQIASDSLIEKKVLKDLKSSKPFLLMIAYDQMTNSEKYIVSKADSIGAIGRTLLYHLPLHGLHTELKNASESFYLSKDSMFHFKLMWIDQPVTSIINLPMTTDTTIFLSHGEFKDSGKVTLFNGAIPDAGGNQQFRISYWLKINSEIFGFPLLYFQQYDKHGQVVDAITVDPKTEQDIYEGWVRVSLEFTLHDPGNTINCFLQGRKIEVSRFLLQPVNLNVYLLLPDGGLVFNNYFIPENIQE